MPSLQQQRGENQSQAKVEPGVRLDLLRQHAHRKQQAEGIDGIEPGEASGPEAARGERSLLGAIGIVIGEDEAGEQQEEADRDVSAVDDRAQRSKRMGIGKMEKDEIEGGKTADARERRQLRSPRRGGGWLTSTGPAGACAPGPALRGPIVLGPEVLGETLRDCALGGQAVTREPTFSPLTTRRMFPGRFMLKMIMGKLLSLHRLTAVLSITFRPSRRISI